jgi:heme oxygenase
MLPAAVVACTPTLTARLRDETAGVRDDRALLGPGTSWLDYRLYLLRLYGFHAAVEGALSVSRSLATVVADAGLRNHKAALIAFDLVVLGVDRGALAQLPRMAFAGALALPEALGWMYVVESATLGSKQIARRLARHLPDLARASAYLGCYGDEAPERWRELGAALDAFEHAARDGDRVVAAARGGFVQLRAWMRSAQPARPAQIRA